MSRIILNPTVSSILSQGCWLRLRWEKHPATGFPVFGIPPSKFHHLSIHQHYSQKIREGGSLDLFTMQNPAVASTHTTAGCRWPLKTFSHFLIFGIPPSKFHHLSIHQHYSQEIREDGPLELFDALNPAVASAHPYNCWSSLRH